MHKAQTYGRAPCTSANCANTNSVLRLPDVLANERCDIGRTLNASKTLVEEILCDRIRYHNRCVTDV